MEPNKLALVVDKDPLRGIRSRTNSGVGETDFVLLQSSPLGHMHWHPVSISVGGNSESLSDHSSRCSSQPPSPVVERKSSFGKASNLKSSAHQMEDPSKRGRHVVIKTEDSENASINISMHDSTVLFDKKNTNKAPIVYHELKNTASQTKARPSTLTLTKHESKNRPSMRNRSKSIDNSQKKKSEKSSFETIHRLKEKLLHSSPELNENLSDNESTPLVSEVSTPSKSGQSSELKTSESNSFPLSPLSQKSLSPELKRFKQTRSEQNLTETTDVSPNISYSDVYFYSRNDNNGTKSCAVSPVDDRSISRTEDISTSHSGLLDTLNHSNSSNSFPSRSSLSSCHLSRQNALESQENLADVYCDPSYKS